MSKFFEHDMAIGCRDIFYMNERIMTMYAFNGKRTNILIITDRLLHTAELLRDFLNNYDDIDCNLIHSLNDFAPDETGILDILISAGYLENIDNWGIVESVRRSNSSAICILWGMVDSCIIDFTDKYNFNEWFERTRPFEDLLEHIREFEDDIYEYNSIGIDLCSELLFSDDDYHIIAYTGNMIKVNLLGIFPLGKIRMKGFPYKAVYVEKSETKYMSCYSIKNKTIFLKDLCIKNHSVKLPALNGVAPDSENYIKEGHVYKGINMPLKYTGSIVIGKDHKEIRKNEDNCILNRMFGWKKLFMLELENGKMTGIKDLSRISKRIRRLQVLFPVLPYITGYSPLLKRMWMDNRYCNEPPQKLYRYYTEYIKFCKNI